MIDKDKVKVAKEWIELLAKGINPTTGEVVKDDDVINDVHISRCLFFVCEILKEVESQKTPSEHKARFAMSAEEAANIPVEHPDGIANFVRRINQNNPSNMRPLSVKTVIDWLKLKGYMMEVVKNDGHKTNHPTEKGTEIGISIETQTNADGSFFTRVVYGIPAQKLILENIASIISCI